MLDDTLSGFLYTLVTGVALVTFLVSSFLLYHWRAVQRRRRELEYRKYWEALRPDLAARRNAGYRTRCHPAFRPALPLDAQAKELQVVVKTGSGSFHIDTERPETPFTHPRPGPIMQSGSRVPSITGSEADQYNKSSNKTHCTRCHAYLQTEDPPNDVSFHARDTPNPSIDSEDTTEQETSIDSNEKQYVASSRVDLISDVQSKKSRTFLKQKTSDSRVNRAEVHHENKLFSPRIESQSYDDLCNSYYEERGATPPGPRMSYGVTGAHRMRSFSVDTVGSSHQLPVLENVYYDNDFRL
ncbi:uncharacterized protein LOC128240298 [Mya arenaria]|uniref:uncharacterized protein LOC128240298 n=1 Tax=Mya arenaria TaxID=6604 RepID=UPI0022DF1D4D|nr:uncharacterized protein LOC128240298 [Mya arenaria]